MSTAPIQTGELTNIEVAILFDSNTELILSVVAVKPADSELVPRSYLVD